MGRGGAIAGKERQKRKRMPTPESQKKTWLRSPGPGNTPSSQILRGARIARMEEEMRGGDFLDPVSPAKKFWLL